MSIYNWKTNQWSAVQNPVIIDALTQQQSELWPSGRSYHVMQLYGEKLWITAGAYISTIAVYTYFNDVHVFNTNTLLWEDVTLRGPTPPARWDPLSIMGSEGLWMAQGSAANVIFNDYWLLAINQAIEAGNFSATGAGLVNITAGVMTVVALQTVDVNHGNLTWGVDLSASLDVKTVVIVRPNPGNTLQVAEMNRIRLSSRKTQTEVVFTGFRSLRIMARCHCLSPLMAKTYRDHRSQSMS